jgi:hypothetical protein
LIDLWDIFQSWHNKVYVALDEDKSLIGYLCTDEKRGRVLECAAKDDDPIKQIIPAWFNFQNKDSIEFQRAPQPNAMTEELTRISDQSIIRASGNWQIFNWPRVVDAVLKLKHKYFRLIDGEFCLGIDGLGQIALVVDGSEARCTSTMKSPDFTCDARTALRLLFGPIPPALNSPITHPLLNSWCPLPLHLQRQDEV